MQSAAANHLVWVLGVVTVFEGIRAGAGTFRLLLDLPARHSLGSIAFATFSGVTDLSTRGVIFYAVYGFGGAVLTGAAWIMARRARADPLVRSLLIGACICSLLVLVFTTQAAPLMWQVGRVQKNAVLLEELLDLFTFWTTLRVLLADLSFLAVVTALTLIAARQSCWPP